MTSAVNHVNGVRKQLCYCVERLDGSAGATWKIEDDRFRANAGYPAREQRSLREFSTFRAHVLGKSGYQPFDRRLCSLRRDVARPYACAAGRQD